MIIMMYTVLFLFLYVGFIKARKNALFLDLGIRHPIIRCVMMACHVREASTTVSTESTISSSHRPVESAKSIYHSPSNPLNPTTRK